MLTDGVLLPAIDSVRELVVDIPVELGGRHIRLRAPALTAVKGDHQNHHRLR